MQTFNTILSNLGTSITFFLPSCFFKRGTSSLLNFSSSRFTTSPLLQYFRSQGDNFQKLSRPQFTGNRTKNTSPNRLFICIYQNRGIFIKTDITSIHATKLGLGANDNRLGDIAFLYL